MAIEIERKFLVKNDSFKREASRKSIIKQGFLNKDKERVVRVRTLDDRGFLTIKGVSDESGTTRKEWEYQIDYNEALDLLAICEPTIIAKTRYFIRVNSHTFEVDVFENENFGLILAEIELSETEEIFEQPDWLGKEVTGDKRYYNSNLSTNPFTSWA